MISKWAVRTTVVEPPRDKTKRAYISQTNSPVAEFKEFERRFKFKLRFKYGWFYLKLYQMFQDLRRRLI